MDRLEITYKGSVDPEEYLYTIHIDNHKKREKVIESWEDRIKELVNE